MVHPAIAQTALLTVFINKHYCTTRTVRQKDKLRLKQ